MSSTSLSHTDAGLQGLVSVDRQVDDKFNAIDPDHAYVNKQDTAELSNNDSDQGPQDTDCG